SLGFTVRNGSDFALSVRTSARHNLGRGIRQQLLEPIDRVPVDHALKHVAQVGVRLDAIHLACFDQRTKCRPSGSTNIRAREEMIFSSKSTLVAILPISGKLS